MKKPALPISISLAAALLALSGCGGPQTTDESKGPVSSDAASDDASDVAGSPTGAAPDAAATPSDAATAPAPTVPAYDQALSNRDNPDRLLRFYGDMIRKGQFAVAARAWDADAGMTAQRLEALHGGAGAAKLSFGKGDVEGAAGSLYYQAPVTIDFADGRPSARGTITLRRVNDVPGASEAQLNWRIETSTLVEAK